MDESSLIFYTVGGFDVFRTLFQAIGALFNGGIFSIIAQLSIGVGILMVVIIVGFFHKIRPVLDHLIAYVILLSGLLMPTGSINIVDLMTREATTVDNIPLALSLVAPVLSTASHKLTQVFEQALQPSPGGPASFEQLCYTKTGFVFGAQAITQMQGLQITNQNLADNMREFVCQCVIYDALATSKYTLHDLKHSGDLWKLVSAKPSKVRGFAWRKLDKTPGDQTEIITCAEGVNRFNALWKSTNESAFTKAQTSLMQFLGMPLEEQNGMFSNLLGQYMPGALNKLSGKAESADRRIQQQIMIDSVVNAIETKSVELGASPNFEVRRAYLQQRESYKTIGQVSAQTLPYLKNILEALFYAIFIFVVGMSMLPSGWKTFIFWVKGVIWLNLWPPLFAVVNFLTTESLTMQVKRAIGSDEGLSIANTVAVASCAADMSAIAAYGSVLIPVFAWMFLERSGYMFSNMAGSILSVSQGAATSVAQEAVSGNYNYGNVGVGGMNAYNVTQLKHDLAPSYSAGHFVENSGTSSRIMAPDGESLINVPTSQIPMHINSAEHQENVKRSALNQAMSTHESENVQASKHHSDSYRKMLELGNHLSKMTANGYVWSNSTTAGVAKEVSDVHNRISSISERLGISEDLANQTAFSIAGGANVGIATDSLKRLIGKDSGPTAGVHAAVNGGKHYFSDSKFQEAMDDLVSLGKSDDYKNAMSHAVQAHKSGDFHSNNQEIKNLMDNMTSSYEKGNTHTQNASKALERAHSLSNEISNIHSQSHQINMDENQQFVNWAQEKGYSAHQIENMTRNEPGRLKELGSQYLNERYGSFKPIETKPMDIEKQYKLAGSNTPYESSYQKDGLPSLHQRGLSNQENKGYHYDGGSYSQDRKGILKSADKSDMSFREGISAVERSKAENTIHAQQTQISQKGRTLKDEYANKNKEGDRFMRRHIDDNMGFFQVSTAQQTYQRNKRRRSDDLDGDK